MIVLIVESGKTPYEKEIKAELESLQREVGGYIQVIYPFSDPVALICNEEGKIEGLPLNRALKDEDGDIYDIIAGTFIVAGLMEESFGSLTETFMKRYTEYFQYPEEFYIENGTVICEKIMQGGEK